MDYGFSKVFDNIKDEIQAKLESSINEGIKEKLGKQLEELQSYQTLKIETKNTSKELKGLKHKKLKQLIKLTSANLNVLMVGMAGTGKTKGASQVAEALDLPFYCISVGSQTSKSDILGYQDANGNYVRTAFREAYENGGIFVMDEIDAGNSNVLIVLNSALANDICSFPDKMVKRHENFRFIATANTYGNGADRTYVGRNQLDGATLDRFVVLDWQIDEALERALVKSYKYGEVWLNTIQNFRKKVEDHGLRAIISPRATIKGSQELELGFKIDEVIESVILPQMPSDRTSWAQREVKNVFKTFKDEFDSQHKEDAKVEQGSLL